MAQYEILEFLEKNKDEWFTAREISEKLEGFSVKAITRALKQLYKFKMVLRKEKYSKNGFVKYYYKYDDF